MKNTLKLLGIIALLAVIGFSMAACSGDDGDADVKLAGTKWKYEERATNSVQAFQIILTFTDSTTVQGEQIDTISPSITTSGTYKISGNSGTMKLGLFGTGNVPFVINGNKLTSGSAEFIKQ